MTEYPKITDEQKTIIYLKYGVVFKFRDDLAQLRIDSAQFANLAYLPFEIVRDWCVYTENLVANLDISYAICTFVDRVNYLKWAIYDENRVLSEHHALMITLSLREIFHPMSAPEDRQILIDSLEVLNALMHNH